MIKTVTETFRLYSSEIKAQARTIYKSGKSTRQIASILGVSNSLIADWCFDILRSKSLAKELRQPAKSKHWRTCRQVARNKVERHLKLKLQTSQHVHHINGDYTDNRLENLEVVNGPTHNSRHTKTLLADGWKPVVRPKGWHHTEEAKAKISAARKQHFGAYKCQKA